MKNDELARDQQILTLSELLCRERERARAAITALHACQRVVNELDEAIGELQRERDEYAKEAERAQWKEIACGKVQVEVNGQVVDVKPGSVKVRG